MVNVIVVDDEEDIQFLFEQEFYEDIREEKINFHFFLSAIDAMKYISKNDINDIDWIVTDICMPGVNGLDFLKDLKSKYPSTRVIMITASVNKEYYNIANDYGAYDYMVKPINFDLLKSIFYNNRIS